MKSLRIRRIEDLLVREISSIINNRVKDPRLGMVTVMAADVSPDIRNARIYVSVMGGEKEKTDSMIGLKRAIPYIRKEVAKGVRLKTIPRIHFMYDNTPAHGEHVNAILKGIRRDT
jgi:ribosome-binding factor A